MFRLVSVASSLMVTAAIAGCGGGSGESGPSAEQTACQEKWNALNRASFTGGGGIPVPITARLGLEQFNSGQSQPDKSPDEIIASTKVGVGRVQDRSSQCLITILYDNGSPFPPVGAKFVQFTFPDTMQAPPYGTDLNMTSPSAESQMYDSVRASIDEPYFKLVSDPGPYDWQKSALLIQPR